MTSILDFIISFLDNFCINIIRCHELIKFDPLIFILDE